MRRLVIVDDEYIVVEGIKAIIQRTGMDIKVVGSAGNGREALETIREMQPDLVITDIRIPYLDGLSLIEECREFLPETDYIVISGYTEFEYARRALLLGVKGYIDKPVTIEKLKDVIDRIGTEPPKESGGLQDTLSMQQSPFVPQHKEEEVHSAIKKLLAYIDENYHRDIGLTELAEMVQMNPAYLSALFKENVGESYIKYLTRIRMDRAKELLTSGMKVTEVAEKVGYSNYNYFCATFKKHTGMIPSEYRNG